MGNIDYKEIQTCEEGFSLNKLTTDLYQVLNQ